MCEAADVPPPAPRRRAVVADDGDEYPAPEPVAAEPKRQVEQLDNNARRLLQQFIARKVLTHHNLLAATGTTDDATAQAVVRRINSRLAACARLEIRRVQCEVPALEVFWGLADAGCTAGDALLADDASLAGSTLSKDQVVFFRKIIDAIVLGEGDDGETGERNEGLGVAISRAREMAGDSGQADAMWARLVRDGWLRVLPHRDCDEQRATLGPRALVELRPYLEHKFGERLPRCVICAEIAVLGERCSNGRCNVRLHRECRQRLFEHNPRKICPQCSSAWSSAPARR